MKKSGALTAVGSSSLTGRNINGGASPFAAPEAQRKVLHLAHIKSPVLLPLLSNQEPDSTDTPMPTTRQLPGHVVLDENFTYKISHIHHIA